MSSAKSLVTSGKKTPNSIKENLAKTSTLHSDTASLRLNLTKPIQALAALYLSTYYHYWQTDVLWRSIAHRAYANCYEGKWELVQEILELGPNTPEAFEQIYCSQYDPFEFYGNILPMAERIELIMSYTEPGKERKNRVRELVRRRGYKDKGSRRLPHEYHGDPPVDDRIDRRQNTNHPLIKVHDQIAEGEKIPVQETPIPTSLIQKGEKHEWKANEYCNYFRQTEAATQSEQT